MKQALALLAVGLMSAMSAQAQTATDLNEGQRVTTSATTGVFTLSWWGQAGRTYFIQQSSDLMTWQYVPTIVSGANGVSGMNFSCSDSRQFWRLRYTDAAAGGNVQTADYDGDGITNIDELNLLLDPLNADTDGDTWNDKLEQTIGSSGANAASTPQTVNPNFIALIRDYDVEVLKGNESYWMDWFATGRNAGEEWWWSQSWNLPGSNDYATGRSGPKPTITYHSYPFSALMADSYWVARTAYYLTWLQAGAVPDYYTTWLDFYPSTRIETTAYNGGGSYKNESGGKAYHWWRYRLKLSETLPMDYSEHFLAVTHLYEPDPVLGWRRTGIREITPMKLEIPAGLRTGSWKFQAPTVDAAGKHVVVQMIPLKIELRANPNKLAPPNPAAMYTSAPENGAHEKLVLGCGLDFNGQEIDRLGELPIGIGRLDDIGGGNAYVAPLETFAVVPDIVELGWGWKREVKHRSWKMHLGRETPLSPLSWLVSVIDDQPTKQDDPLSIHQDVTRSTSTGRIYTGDNSGVNLRREALGLVPGDYCYQERQFSYSLEGTFGGQAFTAATLGVGQVMKIKNNANTYPVQNSFFYLNFDAIENSNAVRVLDVQISEAEVRAIVGGTVPITIPPAANQ